MYSESVRTSRAGVYGRESKGKTASVEDQLERGAAACDDNGWALAGKWRDGVGASAKSRGTRKGWPEVRAAIEVRDIDVLVLWEGSRGARDMSAWVDLLDACRDRGVKVYIVSDERLYDPRKARDRKDLIDQGNDAEYEVNRLAERVCRGTRAAAKAGKFHGRVPFGYRRDIVGEERRERANGKVELVAVKEQRLDPDTAPVVKEIIERVAAGEPLTSLARDLNGRGVASPEGGKWMLANLHTVSENPVYAGLRRHTTAADGKSATYEGTWPAIVPRPIFECAQAVLRDKRARQAVRPGGLRHLLSNIATAPCGGSLSAKRINGGKPAYRCSENQCVTIDQPGLDEWLTALTVARLSEPDARDVFAIGDEASEGAKAEVGALETKLRNARKAFMGSDGSEEAAEMLAELVAEIEPQIKDARRRAVPRGVSAAMLAMLDAVAVGAEHVRPAWNALPLPGKREVLRLVLESITVGKSDRRLSRWATQEQRDRAVEARVTAVPRTTHTAVAAAR
jgi:site-specific DNA recombinase